LEQVTFCKRLAHTGDKTIIVVPRPVASVLDKEPLYQITLKPVDTVSATQARKETE